MVKNSLSASDVCAIIEACGKNKVANLKFGGLDIQMDLKPLIEDALASYMPTSVPEAAISEEQRKQAEKAHLQRELAAAAVEQEELILSDPAKYEELVLQGALDEDESTETDAEA